MGGVEVQLKHFGPVRTGGDTVVYFPDLKIVALGDLFVTAAPEPDFSAGGSLVGWDPCWRACSSSTSNAWARSSGRVSARRR